MAAAGIVFAVVWWTLLQSYRRLNEATYEVINAIEPRLPVHQFTAEQQRLDAMKPDQLSASPRQLWAWPRGYHELGAAERVVPLAFTAIYVAS